MGGDLDDAVAIFTRDGSAVATMMGSGDGPGVFLSGLDGWHNSPTPRSAQGIANLFDGLADEALAYNGRVVTVTGWAECNNPAETLAAGRRLAAVFRSEVFVRHSVDLRVRHHGEDLHATVRLDGVASITPDCTSYIVDFSIPLLVPGGYLYSPERIYNLLPPGSDYGLDWPLFVNDNVLTYGTDQTNSVTVTNAGTSPAWPVIIVQGDFPSGVKLGNGQGKYVVFRAACSISAPVTFDFKAGSVSTTTGDQSVALTSRDFWSIPGGGSVTPTLEPIQAGGGMAELHMCDTWI